MFPPDVPSNVRTLFLSDLHLGFRLSCAAGCTAVLDYFNAETTYLVGDTIDASRLSRIWYWTDGHQAFVDRLLELHHNGKRVHLLPGNHDALFLRDQDFLARLGQAKAERIGRIIRPLHELPMQETFVHRSATGKQLLIIHGDQVDRVNARFLGIPRLGSRIFDYISVPFPKAATLGIRNFWKWILTRPKQIQSRAMDQAREQGLDGLIMGHLHQPMLMQADDGLFVGNTGDWVENSSLIVETHDGEFLLLNQGEMVDRFTW